MTQRDLAKIVGGAVIGLVAAAVLGVGMFGVNFWGDTETDVTLSSVNGTCTLGKATHVRVRKDKQLIWEIENYCTDASQTVTVGNFRKTPAPSAANDCSDAGGDYPFTDADLAARTSTVNAGKEKGDQSIDPSGGKLKLKAKGEPVLGTYYFDICLDGRKADPMLVVER